MTAIVLLFVLALVLFTLEILLPGWILGIIGVGAMVGGCALAFRDYGVGGGLVAVLSGLVLVAGGLVAEFVVLPKTRLGKGLFLDKSITGTAAPQPAGEDLLGRSCVAATVLAPSGVVVVNGKKHEAFCRDGYAENGASLVVRGRDNFRLIVSKS